MLRGDDRGSARRGIQVGDDLADRHRVLRHQSGDDRGQCRVRAGRHEGEILRAGAGEQRVQRLVGGHNGAVGNKRR